MTDLTTPALHVDDLVFKYGKLEVLDNLTLTVSTGEIFGILGANGSGKTTLLRLLLGLIKPQIGVVRVLGKSPRLNCSAELDTCLSFRHSTWSCRFNRT